MRGPAPSAAVGRSQSRQPDGLASFLHVASLLALTAGVCAGAAYAGLNPDIRFRAIVYGGRFRRSAHRGAAGHAAALARSLKANMGSLALIWASGLTVVGMGALTVLAVRVLSGYTVCFIVRELGLAGVALAWHQ